MDSLLHTNSVIEDLFLEKVSLETSDILNNVFEIFEKNKTIPGIIILENGNFYGLLSRSRFFELMSKQFMYDVFSKRRIDYFFENAASGKHLILPSSTPIITATNLALHREESEIFEPIVVTDSHNEYLILDFYQLLVAQNKIQLIMNDLLNQANEFKKEVLAIATHDLRNPIGIIIGFTELINETTKIEKCLQYNQTIQKAAIQMQELVTSFLTTAINDSTEISVELTWFDFNNLVYTVVENMDGMAQKKNQTILLNLSDQPATIESDPYKLKEVIENLISNAIKYSENGKQIKIDVEKKDSNLLFKIEDQGPGFTEEDKKRMFNKFQKLSARPTGNETSTGMGLYIIKKIIQKLKGTITLESHPGIGSKFTLCLPS